MDGTLLRVLPRRRVYPVVDGRVIVTDLNPTLYVGTTTGKTKRRVLFLMEWYF